MSKSINESLFHSLMNATRTLHMKGRHFREDEGRRPPFPPPHEGHGPHRPMLSRERILDVLSDHGEGMRQKALAEELHVGPPAMSEFVNRLEADGYIRREVDPSDRRATLIFLTELGQARAYEVKDERETRLAGMFSGLTEDEKEDLIRLLGKISPETSDITKD